MRKCGGTQMVQYGEEWPSLEKVPWHESRKLLSRLRKYKFSGKILYRHTVICKFHYFPHITIPHIGTDWFSLAHLTSTTSHRISTCRRNSLSEYLPWFTAKGTIHCSRKTETQTTAKNSDIFEYIQLILCLNRSKCTVNLGLWERTETSWERKKTRKQNLLRRIFFLL